MSSDEKKKEKEKEKKVIKKKGVCVEDREERIKECGDDDEQEDVLMEICTKQKQKQKGKRSEDQKIKKKSEITFWRTFSSWCTDPSGKSGWEKKTKRLPDPNRNHGHKPKPSGGHQEQEDGNPQDQRRGSGETRGPSGCRRFQQKARSFSFPRRRNPQQKKEGSWKRRPQGVGDRDVEIRCGRPEREGCCSGLCASPRPRNLLGGDKF